MEEKELRVFVYGTLKPGGQYWNRFCEGKTTSEVPAKIRGQLYHLPLGYPGLVIDPTVWAHGYILTLKDQSVLEGFDVLEGYEEDRNPEENEYDRVTVEVFSLEGESLGQCWTYVMRPERIEEHRGKLVTGTDWLYSREEGSSPGFTFTG